MNQKWREILEEQSLDGILLTDPANMAYFAGFTGEGYVLFSKAHAYVVTDSRYTIATRQQCPEFEVITYGSGGYYQTLIDEMKERSAKRLGFEDKIMTVEEYQKIEKQLENFSVELIPLGAALQKCRQIKSADEIAKIKKAEAIGDLAFEQILKEIREGMTEKEVAARLEYHMKRAGVDGLSFDTIAASGVHSAMPHAVPTDKKLSRGDFLTMDFGCLYQGYCSDMTRTVAIGEASEKQKQVYHIVKAAQEKALSGIRPGMTGKEIDALARNVIAEAGYGEYFGHALGHSVGREIHESPNFSPREDQIIQPGMVITVEPGIYIKDEFGVRIEDVVVITEDGCENITHSRKDLVVIEG